MNKLSRIILLSVAIASLTFAKDHSGEYQGGTVSMSALSGREIYIFTYSDGKVGDVVSREKFSVDSFENDETGGRRTSGQSDVSCRAQVWRRRFCGYTSPR
jgi:hypothetical protein